MIVITIAFVPCFSWLRSGIERYADRKLSLCCQFFVSGFVGLLTYPFMRRRHSSHTNALLQPSLGAMTALPMTGFHRTQDLPCTENNTLEIQLLSEFCLHLCILWFIGCRRRKEIPSVSGIYTRFPCSANKHACPIARVAHLPQKPCYLVYICVPNFTHTKRPLLPCYLAGKRSLVFSVYSVWLYAKTTFLFK